MQVCPPRCSYWLCWCVLWTVGCAPSFQRQYLSLKSHLKANRPEQAMALLESHRSTLYGSKNELLYWMDKAMVEHIAGRYASSNQCLEHAKHLAERLWTESISAHAEAWLTTDNALPYQGEDFERIFVTTLAAINHSLLGHFSQAAVEARQIHAMLALYETTYKQGQTYKEDAFARWLSGLIAEVDDPERGLNDAWIDYKRALALYGGDYPRLYKVGLPKMVLEEAWRLLSRLGPDFTTERQQLLQQQPGLAQVHPPGPQQARIVMVHLVGEAPHKQDRYWTVPVGAQVVRIAYPTFVPGETVGGHFLLQLEGQRGEQTFDVLQNMEAIAVRNLDDHMQRIQSKAIARAVGKYMVGRGLQALGEGSKSSSHPPQQGCTHCSKVKPTPAPATGQALAAIWQIGQFLLEEADKRSWLLLPQRIEGQVLYVEPGRHALRLVHVVPSGQKIVLRRFEVDVTPGATALVVHRSFP